MRSAKDDPSPTPPRRLATRTAARLTPATGPFPYGCSHSHVARQPCRRRSESVIGLGGVAADPLSAWGGT
jgi:hypothetical protein